MNNDIIRIIDLKDEDFVNYKKPSMYISFPFCTFKCGKENCQNAQCENAKIIEISANKIARRYVANNITSAIVIAGLEPFDSYDELRKLVVTLRKYTKDDIVIYTGYNKDEIYSKVKELAMSSNLYVKFGRYIPNEESHYDEVLGVQLASSNQYAEHVKFLDM